MDNGAIIDEVAYLRQSTRAWPAQWTPPWGKVRNGAGCEFGK